MRRIAEIVYTYARPFLPGEQQIDRCALRQDTTKAETVVAIGIFYFGGARTFAFFCLSRQRLVSHLRRCF